MILFSTKYETYDKAENTFLVFVSKPNPFNSQIIKFTTKRCGPLQRFDSSSGPVLLLSLPPGLLLIGPADKFLLLMGPVLLLTLFLLSLLPGLLLIGPADKFLLLICPVLLLTLFLLSLLPVLLLIGPVNETSSWLATVVDVFVEFVNQTIVNFT